MGGLLRRRHFWTGLLALVATLYNLEVDPEEWASEDVAVFKRNKPDVFNYVTRPEEVPEFAPVFRTVEETDGRPFGVGKTYKTVSNVFFDWELQWKVVELKRGHLIRLESQDWLCPAVTVEANWQYGNGHGQKKSDDKPRTELKMKVAYNRKSVLFQYTVGPVLRYVTHQHVRHALFVLNWLLPPHSA